MATFLRPDIALCFQRSLRRASNRVAAVYDRSLAGCGLLTLEFAILAHIEKLGAATNIELASGLDMRRAAFRYRLGPLERACFVASVDDPEDGRDRRFVLTEAGREKLSEAWKHWAEAQPVVEGALGADAESFRSMTDALFAAPSPTMHGSLPRI